MSSDLSSWNSTGSLPMQHVRRKSQQGHCTLQQQQQLSTTGSGYQSKLQHQLIQPHTAQLLALEHSSISGGAQQGLLPLVSAFDPLEAGPFEQLLQHMVLHVGAALLSKVTRHVLGVWRAVRRLWQNSCKLQTTHSATLRVRTQSNTVISSTHAATHSVTQSTIQPSNYLVHSSNIQGEGEA